MDEERKYGHKQFSAHEMEWQVSYRICRHPLRRGGSAAGTCVLSRFLKSLFACFSSEKQGFSLPFLQKRKVLPFSLFFATIKKKAERRTPCRAFTLFSLTWTGR
ncbi:MAG: hypothetical protein IJR89_07290 [Clostridia bacterium]|nr:hypothetical protein [Clostridia bacterium]